MFKFDFKIFRALNEIGISDIKPLLEDGMLQSYSTLRVKDGKGKEFL